MALSDAAANGHADCVRLLLQSGADKEVTSVRDVMRRAGLGINCDSFACKNEASLYDVLVLNISQFVSVSNYSRL